MARSIWSADAWETFKTDVRTLYANGVRGYALSKRLESLPAPLYASADPRDHAQIYEDAVRYLVACGYLPASMAP